MTIQLLSCGQGIFVERDNISSQVVVLTVNGEIGGKFYHNNKHLVPDENGCYHVTFKKGHNTFSYRQGTMLYTIEPIRYNGQKAVIESVIGTTQQYASALEEIAKMEEKVKDLEALVDKLNKQINGTQFLFN